MLVLASDRCGACGYPVLREVDRCSECGAVDRGPRRMRLVSRRPVLVGWLLDVVLAHRMVFRRMRLEEGRGGLLAVGAMNLVVGCLLIAAVWGVCAMGHTLFEDGPGHIVWVPVLFPMVVCVASSVLVGMVGLLWSAWLFGAFLVSRMSGREPPMRRLLDVMAQLSFLSLQLKAVGAAVLLCLMLPLASGWWGLSGVGLYERLMSALPTLTFVTVDVLVLAVAAWNWLRLCPRAGAGRHATAKREW